VLDLFIEIRLFQLCDLVKLDGAIPTLGLSRRLGSGAIITAVRRNANDNSMDKIFLRCIIHSFRSLGYGLRITNTSCTDVIISLVVRSGKWIVAVDQYTDGNIGKAGVGCCQLFD
jgi:hypothetical protein